MKFRAACLLFSLAMIGTAGPVSAGAPVGPAFGSKNPFAAVFEDGKPSVEIPCKFLNGLIFVFGQMGSERVCLLLDSGAGLCSVEENLIKAMGLKVRGKEFIKGIGDTLPLQTIYSGAVLKFPGLRLDIPYLLGDKKAILPALEGVKMDGILGLPGFAATVVEINYERQKVTLHHPVTYRYSGPGKAVAIDVKSGSPSVKAAIGMEYGPPARGNFIIDTGCNGILYLSETFYDTHRILQGEAGQGAAVGIGGQAGHWTKRVRSLILGPFTFKEPMAEFAKAPGGIGSNFNFEAGLIGSRILNRFTVIFDYPGARMILEPNRHLDEPFE